MVIDETELEGLTEDQRDAYIALKEGRNVFLSGNAGTGKSYVLNRFIDDLEARSVPYTAMAPTGIAALNIFFRSRSRVAVLRHRSSLSFSLMVRWSNNTTSRSFLVFPTASRQNSMR